MAFLKETLVVKVDVKPVSNELHRITFPKGAFIHFVDLESKICTRFGLTSKSGLRLTYKDDGGDVVVMADDDNLSDAIDHQSLNPLRIHGVVKSPGAAPEVEPVPPHKDQQARSSDNEFGQHDLASDIANFFSAVRERNTSPVEHTSPVEYFMRLFGERDGDFGKSLEKSIKAAEEISRFGMQTSSGVATSALKALRGKASTSQVPPPASSEGSKTDVVPAAPKAGNTVLSAESEPVRPANSRSFQQIGGGVQPEGEQQSQLRKRTGSGPIMNEEDAAGRVFHTRVQCDGCGMLPIMGPRFKHLVKDDYDLCGTCYSMGDDKENYSRIDRPLYKPRHQPSRSSRISGPRVACKPPLDLFGGRPFHPAQTHRGPFGAPPPPLFPCNQQLSVSLDWLPDGLGIGKLDSRFVRDVSIFDGTELAPGAEFTKIWCLRNSGTISWPQGTVLLHIGGDKMGDVTSVVLPLPPSGLAVGEECEVAVDSVAPEHPGRYVSHWRLAAPRGPRFGHRVWFLIQVVPREEVSKAEPCLPAAVKPVKPSKLSVVDLIIVAPKEVTVQPSSEVDPAIPATADLLVAPTADTQTDASLPLVPIVEADASPVEVVFDTAEAALEISDSYHMASEVSESLHTPSEVDLEEEVNASDDSFSAKLEADLTDLLADESKAAPEATVEGTTVPESPTKTENTSVGGFALLPYPAVTMSPVKVDEVVWAVETLLKSEESYRVEVESVESSEDDYEPEYVEEEENSSLADLEAMGFPDMILNGELLVKNKGDVMKTVEDLVAAADWDPMMAELTEMGFTDVRMNLRLMFKNNGSVKRVVKELVELYKAEAATKNAK